MVVKNRLGSIGGHWEATLRVFLAKQHLNTIVVDSNTDRKTIFFKFWKNKHVGGSKHTARLSFYRYKSEFQYIRGKLPVAPLPSSHRHDHAT